MAARRRIINPDGVLTPDATEAPDITESEPIMTADTNDLFRDDIPDEEVTVVSRGRNNPVKDALGKKVDALANAYENGHVVKSKLPFPDSRTKYSYQNWLRGIGEKLSESRGYTVKYDTVKYKGTDLIRFWVEPVTSGE